MYHIIDICESTEEKRNLLEYSGYCVIILIAGRIEQSALPANEESEKVDYAFLEYDHGNRKKRPPNSHYINAVNQYLKRNGWGQQRCSIK